MRVVLRVEVELEKMLGVHEDRKEMAEVLQSELQASNPKNLTIGAESLEARSTWRVSNWKVEIL